MSKLLMPRPVLAGFSASLIDPTIVTSSPSRIHTVPRPITTIQCHRAHGRRSSRAGMSVVMRPVSTVSDMGPPEVSPRPYPNGAPGNDRPQGSRARTTSSRTPSGSEPESRTAEWNCLTEKPEPWRCSASARIRWISRRPTMYDVAWPGETT